MRVGVVVIMTSSADPGVAAGHEGDPGTTWHIAEPLRQRSTRLGHA
jgi:hypothetical protein